MWPEPIKEYLSDFLSEWMRAEEVLKLTERIRNEAMMASIQELRYAARRLVQALIVLRDNEATHKEDCEKEIQRHMIEAIENCIKARHDAVDAAVSFVHARIDEFVKSVGVEITLQCFPNFATLRGQIKRTDKLIVESRAQRKHLDPSYDLIRTEHLPKIVDFYDELVGSESLAKKLIEEKKVTKRRNDFKNLVIGLVASLIVLFIGVRFDKEIKDFFGITPSIAEPAKPQVDSRS